MLTLPNLLTLSRILLILPILWLMKDEQYIVSFFLSIIAFITDFLDGKIARHFGSTSLVGTILDPVADKLITLALMTFFMMQGDVGLPYYIISTGREISQLLAIPILIGNGIVFKVKPKLLPKIATALKFIILSLLFLQVTPTIDLTVELLSLMLVSAILEVYIWVTYMKRFFLIYKGHHDTFE